MEAILAPILNFLVVVFIFWFFGRKPFGAFLVSRSQGVENSILDAEAASKTAGADLAQWKNSWSSSEAHAKQQLDEAKVAMTKLSESSKRFAATESERIKKEATLVSQSEVIKARVSLQREVAEKSVKLAEAYLSGHLAEKDQNNLVTEYVEIVGNGTA